MPSLVLLRHGQSQWNLENRFTGWWDVDLSEQGVAEARTAGALLKSRGIDFDCCFTSVLTRAIRTLHLTLHEMDRLWLPVTKHWRLNERHYGGLTGLNKQEMIDKVGAEQVKIWRRSYDIPPPPLPEDSPCDVSHDRRYEGIPVPNTESLKDTIARALPYYEAEIVPALKRNETVLVAAHGNSIRGIIKHLSNIGDDEIVGRAATCLGDLEACHGRVDEAMAAVGDDWPDLPLLTRAAFACAPANAHAEVLAVAHHVTSARGGYGAARECCDLMLMACGAYARLLHGHLTTLDAAP